MAILLAVLAGSMYAAGIYMILRRSLVKLAIGLILLTHGANLTVFASGGAVRGTPPLVAEGETSLANEAVDPVPQALVLTAIVIGFGLLAFAISLIFRLHHTADTDDVDDLRSTER